MLFEIRNQGLVWLCLTVHVNLNWVQAAEAWSSLPHWQAQITTRFKVVLLQPGPGLAEAATCYLNWPYRFWRPPLNMKTHEVSPPCFHLWIRVWKEISWIDVFQCMISRAKSLKWSQSLYLSTWHRSYYFCEFLGKNRFANFRASQSCILCRLRNLQPPQHVNLNRYLSLPHACMSLFELSLLKRRYRIACQASAETAKVW